MKKVEMEQASLDSCVKDAQGDRVVLMRGGKPVALVVGVEGLDAEQLQLGQSDKFWSLIAERRGQKTLTRAELEEEIGGAGPNS